MSQQIGRYANELIHNNKGSISRNFCNKPLKLAVRKTSYYRLNVYICIRSYGRGFDSQSGQLFVQCAEVFVFCLGVNFPHIYAFILYSYEY